LICVVLLERKSSRRGEKRQPAIEMEMSSWIVWGVAAGLVLAVVHFGGVYIRGGVSERSRGVEKVRG
jgi:glucokinase